MGVPRYTTPVFRLTFSEKDLNLTEASEIFVTFKQADKSITFTGDQITVEEKTISVPFSQEDSGGFCYGDVEIQVNWTKGAKRAASGVAIYQFTKQLFPQVIEYEHERKR